ncbi:hypothetical protein KBZ10_09210 [Streptomyces sp. F63]|uniref:hypothetical protein n=1 Tax=Streptomyces sp. F63 TaxID=2824887 RepID=UPI001B36CB7D|nr:hypothetical protein [Streptomyces sp. F63]MBQ0984691.1 hypothetical protein [Streptomyces sp. F63]
MSTASLRLLLGTLTAALLYWLCGPVPARAADPVAAPGSSAEIAAALAESPVYVAGRYRSAVPAGEQRALERQIERTGLPVKVVLLPFEHDDRWSGDSDQLAGALRERLTSSGREQLVLITVRGWTDDGLAGYEWPDDSRYDAFHAALAVNTQQDLQDEPLGTRVARAIDIVEAGTGLREYEKAKAAADAREADEKDRADGTDGAEGTEGTDGRPGASLLLPAAGAAAVLVLAAGVVRWLRARRRAALPYPVPGPVFAAAREADEQAVRRRAQEEVLRLGEELGELESGTSPSDAEALRRALDAYAAAGTVLDGARGLPDLAGVLALVAEGRDALGTMPAGKRRAGKGTPGLPLCFFHPLHGRAVRRITWRPLGRRESLQAAACAECTRAVRARRAPETLMHRHEGREVPYFDVPAHQSLWAATGYGSLGTEPLTARVQRGDFTRAARAREREAKP